MSSSKLLSGILYDIISLFGIAISVKSFDGIFVGVGVGLTGLTQHGKSET
jgi:hypothetical protein